MKSRILLVEDDDNLGFVTQDQLMLAGFEVVWVKKGDEGFDAFGQGQFDLCLLDVMLPNQDGFTLASQIRSVNEFVPILFVTARSFEDDRLKGFEVGGDDYVTKPFSMDELIYRVKVFLRRTSTPIPESEEPNEMIGIGNYQFDPVNLKLSIGSENIELTQMEGNLLRMLAQRPNQLIKREEILIQIWGENDYFKGRSLDVFVSRLRKYLKDDVTIELRNHHGVGFALCF